MSRTEALKSLQYSDQAADFLSNLTQFLQTEDPYNLVQVFDNLVRWVKGSKQIEEQRQEAIIFFYCGLFTILPQLLDHNSQDPSYFSHLADSILKTANPKTLPLNAPSNLSNRIASKTELIRFLFSNGIFQ